MASSAPYRPSTWRDEILTPGDIGEAGPILRSFEGRPCDPLGVTQEEPDASRRRSEGLTARVQSQQHAFSQHAQVFFTQHSSAVQSH